MKLESKFEQAQPREADRFFCARDLSSQSASVDNVQNRTALAARCTLPTELIVGAQEPLAPPRRRTTSPQRHRLVKEPARRGDTPSSAMKAREAPGCPDNDGDERQ